LATDPQFVNAASYDFHLQAGSPAIDRASTGASIDHDGVARPQGAARDLGAYEWASQGTGGGGSCTTTVLSAWGEGAAFPTQSGTLRVEVDLTPSTSSNNSLFGISAAAAADYTGMAAIVGFMPSGQLQVRNGGAYAADIAVSYTAGATYHVRMDIDLASHTYTVFVTPPGGCETAIATHYAFRGEQAGVTSLGFWNVHSDVGALTACNVAVWLRAL
jgi:hypothetical protein